MRVVWILTPRFADHCRFWIEVGLSKEWLPNQKSKIRNLKSSKRAGQFTANIPPVVHHKLSSIRILRGVRHMERSYRLTLDDVLDMYGDVLLRSNRGEATSYLTLYGEADDATRIQAEFGWTAQILEYLDAAGALTLNDDIRWRRIIVQQRREGKCVESIFTAGASGGGVTVSHAMYPWVAGVWPPRGEGEWI
jgi:hypothetical protein